MMNRPLIVICLIALLTPGFFGCTTVGPDYRTPTAPVQPGWIEKSDRQLVTSAEVSRVWWQQAFDDPMLNWLIETALAQNLSLRSAGLRVLQARQQLLIAIGRQYPQQQQINAQAEITGLFSSPAYEIYDLGFNVSWEADIWGSFKRQIESSSAALDASVAEYDGVQVSLIAEIARNYLLIRTTQARLEVARQNLNLQQESVRITSAKFAAGAVSSLDLEQAQTLLYTTEASIYVFEQSLQQLKNSLAVLLGRPPGDMGALLETAQPIPSVAADIATGMPQDLIRRRPDIRAAERLLAAQSAQIGVAVSELYPHMGLGGVIGTSVSTAGGLKFGDLLQNDTSSYNFLGFFQWNIFNYGRLKNNVRLQDALFQQLLEDYRETVLRAQGEVENAIVAFLKSHQQLAAYQAAADAAQRAADVSTEQYMDGLVDFNTVLSTLRALATQQDQLAAAKGTLATDLIDVYRSLGGGWTPLEGGKVLDLIPEQTREEMLRRSGYWKKTFENK